MSAGDPSARQILAKWRRAGHGVWRMTFIIEGFDGEFVHLLPGRMSQWFAERLGKRQCAQQHNVHRKYVHLQSMELET